MANKYNLSKEYQFDIDVAADTYCGKLSMPYVTAAVKSPDTVARGYVRQIDGLNKSAVISGLSLSDPIQVASCDFSITDAPANLALTEQILTLHDMKVNQQICRNTIFPTWVGENMDRNGNLPSTFSDFLLATVAGKAGAQLENLLWLGDAGALFGAGFVSGTGVFNEAGVDASACAGFVESTLTAGGITATNAAGEFGLVYDSAIAGDGVAAGVPGILNAPDISFYCNLKTYGLYIQHLAGAGALTTGGYNNQMTNQAIPAATYLGIPINVCPGMPDDCIVLTPVSNMVFGTNLATDWTEARLIPTYEYDGSDAVRVVMNFAVGVQTAVATDGVVGATFWT